MAYFKINNIDFSMYVNELKVAKDTNYTSQTNAAGNTVVDFINLKREIEVGIIPVEDAAMKALLAEVDKFNVKLSFLNPKTNLLEDNVNVIIPSSNIEVYYIGANTVKYKAFTLKFIEL